MEIQFQKFVESGRPLEIWQEDKLIFQSDKEMVGGLLDFIKQFGGSFKDMVIFDTKAGNAVALLAAHLAAKKVYAALGSETAKKTLEKFGIGYHFLKTIPNILNKEGTDICPLEKKSFSKTPEEFYQSLTQ